MICMDAFAALKHPDRVTRKLNLKITKVKLRKSMRNNIRMYPRQSGLGRTRWPRPVVLAARLFTNREAQLPKSRRTHSSKVHVRSLSPDVRCPLQLSMPAQQSVKTWRLAHVLIYLCCIATSLGALLSYRNLNALLQNNVNKCLLYAKPSVEKQEEGPCHFDLLGSEWSSDLLCDYVFFAILASFVYGIIAVWFFLMCAPSSRGTPDDNIVSVWKIVPPAAFFSALLMLFTVIMAWKVSGGLNAVFSDPEFLDAVSRNCTLTNPSVPWDSGTFATVRSQRLMAQVFIWLMALSWILATSTLVCRCTTAADFVNTPE
ncbi:uncharacterized protein ISCGN_020683, partial [Ixodes scapularis]